MFMVITSSIFRFLHLGPAGIFCPCMAMENEKIKVIYILCLGCNVQHVIKVCL